jgi:predicted O-methyltransferase YrrM
MDGKWFELWFRHILPYLDPNCIAILDNALYHGDKAENVPSKSWTKEHESGYIPKTLSMMTPALNWSYYT